MKMEGNGKNELPNASESKTLEQALGSQYALQVALQTMKERCQNLQARLANVEEENANLRSKKNIPIGSLEEVTLDVKSELDHLQDQVTQLMRQKSQLTHHIGMVANENQQLWNRLSRVTQANYSLGSHLSKISHTLSKHDSSGNGKAVHPKMTAISNDITTKCDIKTVLATTANPSDQSLDEISLKLINSLIQEKAELEDQYSQMVDIQTANTFPIHNLGFLFLEHADDATLLNVGEHCSQMQELKKMLNQQQIALKSTIELLKKFKYGREKSCHHCRAKEKHETISETQHEDKAYLDTLRQWGAVYKPEIHSEPEVVAVEVVPSTGANKNTDNSATFGGFLGRIQNEDRLCPMCGQFYPKQLPFEEFQSHVMSHFNDDFDPALENFEVVM